MLSVPNTRHASRFVLLACLALLAACHEAPAVSPPREVASVNFNDARFADVIDHFRKALGVDITADWAALKETGIDENSTITLRLSDVPPRRAFDLAVGELPAEDQFMPAVVFEEGRSLVVSTEQARPPRTERRVYDLAGIVHEQSDGRLFTADDLFNAVTFADTRYEIWNQGDCLSIEVKGEQAVVCAPAASHARIEKLLAALRAPPGAAPVLLNGGPADPPAIAKLAAGRLRAPISVAFDAARFEDVIECLRNATKLNFLVRWNRFKDFEIGRDSPITLRLAGVPGDVALAAALHQLANYDQFDPPSFRVNDDGIVVVCPLDELVREPQTWLYDVSEFASHKLDENDNDIGVVTAIAVIETLGCNTELWESRGGTVNSLRAIRDKMLFRAMRDDFLTIDRAIAAVRAPRPLPMMRFKSGFPACEPPPLPAVGGPTARKLAEVSRFEFKAVPLREVIGFFAAKTGLRFDIDREELDKLVTERDTPILDKPITLSLGPTRTDAALAKILEMSGRDDFYVPAYVVEQEGVVVITSRYAIGSRARELRVYDVNDFMPDDGSKESAARKDALIEMIGDALLELSKLSDYETPNTWSIPLLFDGRLIVGGPLMELDLIDEVIANFRKQALGSGKPGPR